MQEVSGAVGDLGTFLPIVVALVVGAGLDLGTTLLFSGIYNIVSGITFGIPMCVQPMKTIAAVALSSPGLSVEEMMAAGIFVSGAVLVLGATGLMDSFQRLVPHSLVRGIQLGLGLQLGMQGIKLALLLPDKSWRGWWGLDGLLLGAGGLVFLLVTTIAPPEGVTTASGATGERGEGQATEPFRGTGSGAAGRATGTQEPARHTTGEGDAETGALPGIRSEAAGQVASQPARGGASDSHQGLPDEWVEAAGRGRVGGTGADGAREHGGAAHEQEGLLAGGGGASCVPQPTAGLSCSGAGACGGSGGRPPRLPSALLVVAAGAVLSAVSHPSALATLRLGPSPLRLVLPSASDFASGVRRAGLAQLPLTCLNSVVAVTQLADQIFPERRAEHGWRWRPSAVATSVGLLNLVGCWFGAFPCCHGSGGLAAQVKFGARSGAAPVLLGAAKAVLALALGGSLLQLLHSFPPPLLGAMLAVSGVELASAARAERSGRGVTLMALTAATTLAFADTGVGFALGAAAALAVAAYEAASGTLLRLLKRRRDPQDGLGFLWEL